MTNSSQPGRPAGAPLNAADDMQWASLAHLGGILGIVPSLVIWLVFKDRGPFTDREAKEALNFQITAAIAWAALFLVTSVLTTITFGLFGLVAPLVYLALFAAVVVFSIMGYLKAKDGAGYRYPFALRLVK